MFKFDAETAAAIIAREDSLHTLGDHPIADGRHHSHPTRAAAHRADHPRQHRPLRPRARLVITAVAGVEHEFVLDILA